MVWFLLKWKPRVRRFEDDAAGGPAPGIASNNEALQAGGRA
jgi:hypothetical protein